MTLRNMNRLIGISSLLNRWMSPQTWSQRGYLAADVLGLAIVNAGNNPHVVEPPNGRDLHAQNAALGHILFQNHRATAV